MNAMFKFDFQQKRKQLHFTIDKCLNYTHKNRQNFACDNYLFFKIRVNKNKQ